MTYCLLWPKLSSEPMLAYQLLNIWKQISVNIWTKCENFLNKLYLKIYCLPVDDNFCEPKSPSDIGYPGDWIKDASSFIEVQQCFFYICCEVFNKPQLWYYILGPLLLIWFSWCKRCSLRMDKLFHSIYYWTCDYLAMMGLKLKMLVKWATNRHHGLHSNTRDYHYAPAHDHAQVVIHLCMCRC